VKFLPDVNVLFPLLVSRHAHRDKALEWFDGTNAGEAALCRLTRLGVLRLLCTPQVMGPDVLQPKTAVEALEMLEADERIIFLQEPEGVDSIVKSLVARRATTPNLWTDAYLAAFAKAAKLQLVTFDRGFSKFTGIDCCILSPAAA
jgi:uncharacterized protein